MLIMFGRKKTNHSVTFVLVLLAHIPHYSIEKSLLSDIHIQMRLC